MSDDEFLGEFSGEYPAFAPAPAFTGDLPDRGYVTGNFVAEPGAYACVRCSDALAPPHVLRSGQRVPQCPRCGPDARWARV